MDSFDLALLQEWDLDDLCGYDQDKNVLRRNEWERRTQEVQHCEDTFQTNYPLFSEPYKTSKGDELSSRIQSTLGNYDEIKDLLTDRSNQSHLVGIPKTDALQIPVGKTGDHYLQQFREAHYSLCSTVQPGTTPATVPVQLNKGATMNWQEPGLAAEGQEKISKAGQRMLESPSSDFKTGPQKLVTEKTKSYPLSLASSTSSSTDTQQHVLNCTVEDALNRQKQSSKLNGSLALGISIKERPCNKKNNSAHCVQNFPAALASKLNAVQQKPTAYVRPMDGQDQAPNESPKLKSSTENNILFPLCRGLSNKTDSIRIQTDKIDPFSDPNQDEDNQHGNVRLNSQKEADLKIRSPTNCAAQISLLEDDLKLSSDEDDSDQQAAQEQAIRVKDDSGEVQQCSNRASGVSIRGSSSSSSESDTSSESDSESESSSSESENSKPSGNTSPELEQPTSNKWQLDKWLNKVNPNKSAILSHTQSLCYSGIQEGGKSCEKALEVCQSSLNDKDIRIPSREDQRPRVACTAQGNKGVTEESSAPVALDATAVVAIPTESISERRTVCRKLTRRTERTSGGENLNCHTSDTSLSQGTLGDNIPGQPKNRLVCSSRGLHRKEPRTAIVGCERRRTRGLCRSVPKSKEFIESSSQSSDHGTETDLEVSSLSKTISATPFPATENNHRLKECGSNNISRANPCSATGFVNARTTSDIAKELEEQYYTLVPFGRNEHVCPLKGSNEVKSLWVRIDLTLLSRIPEGPPQKALAMNTSTKEAHSPRQHKVSTQVAEKALLKTRRKRKFENEGAQDMKKNHVEKDDCPRLTDSVDNFKTSNTHSTNIYSDGFYSTSKSSGGNLLPSFISSSRNRRVESQSHLHQRSLPIPSENTPVYNTEDLQSDLWSPLSNGHNDSRRTKLLLDNMPRNADYFMQEAKRMKHKADAMMDKFDKVLYYTEAALSFIECGNAMEHGPMESKSPYAMYSETVELIRYALRLKTHLGPNATSQDKKITALCYRCLALLYWRMFRLKRDHAVKYSKALIDYFKSSSKVPQTPSPWSANGKTTGTPSPMSPSPSPVSSVGSQGSISSTGTPSSASIISIPQRIHQMAANHVSITNSILHSYDYWEIADNLTKDNTEFFNELDALMGPITLHSSMEHLVQYTRQGLHWVRHGAHAL
ncbi:AF4/FMR2 family member 3 isoform X2 [Ascaphus truei]|uniref:AF4/FMR2 family member 3 isoform X2 n=1 Tax=Ascaphus truei TaxID=8439 RepID=UPI003F5A0E68